MTVREVCLLGFNPHMHILGGYTTNMIKRADKAIDMVGLKGLYEADFLALSEGQKQLCILARTIIEASPLLLLDEPDSALDFSNRHLLMQHIKISSLMANVPSRAFTVPSLLWNTAIIYFL